MRTGLQLWRIPKLKQHPRRQHLNVEGSMALAPAEKDGPWRTLAGIGLALGALVVFALGTYNASNSQQLEACVQFGQLVNSQIGLARQNPETYCEAVKKNIVVFNQRCADLAVPQVASLAQLCPQS